MELCLALFISGTMGSSIAIADTFTWVDGNGIVNYAERMPRNVDSSRVTRIRDNTRPGAGSAGSDTDSPSSSPNTPTNYSSADEGDLSEGQQQMLAELQAAEAERQTKVAAVRNDNCERSRRVLNNLSNVSRVRVVAEDGSVSVLPEEERITKIKQAQQGIATNCNQG